MHAIKNTNRNIYVQRKYEKQLIKRDTSVRIVITLVIKVNAIIMLSNLQAGKHEGTRYAARKLINLINCRRFTYISASVA